MPIFFAVNLGLVGVQYVLLGCGVGTNWSRTRLQLESNWSNSNWSPMSASVVRPDDGQRTCRARGLQRTQQQGGGYISL